MAIYSVGDIQGCDAALSRLLQHLDFSPSRDTLYLLGDLVNRGPDSGAVLRRCMQLGDSARAVLGNHDLHLLATAVGVRPPSRRDTLTTVLNADDRPALLHGLRHQPLARQATLAGQTLLLVHAGVLPAWDAAQTLALAAEVQQQLQSPDWADFFQHMYGNQPDRWQDGLRGWERLRVIVNALTRLRFCSADGRMDFDSSESAHQAPPGLLPWFDVPGRRSQGQTIAFGHWSTLGLLNRPDVLGLDTGCVWGGCLTAVRFGSHWNEREFIQVACEQAQQPGV